MHKFVILFMLICIVFVMLVKADDKLTLCEKATINATEVHWKYVIGKDTNLTNSYNAANIMKKECKEV